MYTRRDILAGILALLLPISVSAQTSGAAPAVLSDGWKVAELSAASLNSGAISDIVEKIDSGWIPNVHALLIEHEGRLVFEQYWAGEDISLQKPLSFVEHGPDTLHDIRSITKSVTSLLLGIALDDAAEEALERPISSFFPERDDLDDRLMGITLHDVLTMTAGLDWNETILPYSDPRNDFQKYNTTADPIGYVLSKEQRYPSGSRWNYSSGLTDVIAGVIENLTGKPLESYADEVLFGPLGITDYDWMRPEAWPPDHFPSASAGLRMKARDLAKIGSLVLHRGAWQGRQIVPELWIELSTTGHIPLGGDYSYGYFWYSSSVSDARTPIHGSPVVRGIGSGNQGMLVLPMAGLSITVFAGNYDNDSAVDFRIMSLIAQALE